MLTFIVSIVLLLLGYFFYGSFVDRMFAPKFDKPTPAYTLQDGVDYVPMPLWKAYLIQFLNIAGTGPIFGAILGSLFGPAAYIWIVLGCIFGGAVHDYFTGMMSLRKNGASIPELVGDELGNGARLAMRVLSLVLLVLVGAVFARTPADLVASLTPTDGFWGSSLFWLIVIVVYYILATLLPIDKLIGRVYPLFGAALLIMAVGVGYGILTQNGGLPEIDEAFSNHNPNASTTPLFPCLCITIACGAVSGFHATQSPLMARCLQNETHGRLVFYGAMVTEGLVALIWAAGAIKFADSLGVPGDTPYEKLLYAMTEGGAHSANPAIIVHTLCSSWLGTVGSVLAVLGVVAAPITSGDTAFRSARLIAADFMKMKQNKIYKRLVLALPLFAIAIILFFIDFQVLWRYFAWFNQTLACIALWAFSVKWTKRDNAKIAEHPLAVLVTLVPALWMTMVSASYICIAKEGFEMGETTAYIIGGVVTIASLVLYSAQYKKIRNK